MDNVEHRAGWKIDYNAEPSTARRPMKIFISGTTLLSLSIYSECVFASSDLGTCYSDEWQAKRETVIILKIIIPYKKNKQDIDNNDGLIEVKIKN